MNPRAVSSWVTCKLCRCFSRYAPCWNKLLSISLHIPFRLCLRVCSMLFFLTASSSGELLFLFCGILVFSPCARKAAILTSWMIAKLFWLNRLPSGRNEARALFEALRWKKRQGWIFLRLLKSTLISNTFELSDGLWNKAENNSVLER